MVMISRRKLADRSAARIVKGDSKKNVLKELAAYLIDTGRVREAELIVKDIEAALAGNGLIVATVTSARALSTSALSNIESFVKGQYEKTEQIVLHEQIDENLISGIKLELPGKALDMSVKAKLDKLTV
jgi:F-type H+-transporting ATPase subunit delta